ncbi:PorT family protein [Taibaiella lutea]|uniref:PorT family protein n=1 Tax=Taibaiella lutea TaxID=2608001 RepID=A0A5M6CFH2_9BACT|nr:outer membrane beta-barrel protein [Taibaiella lutea]KAA5533190.1 PorT family protein [Taibaiella lutea]
MDNPNDFIHIDEVFRKLKDKEEPEGTGSWMRMKDLLDNAMPVGSPAPVSALRRYMIPMIAMLLIGSGLSYYGISKYNSTKIPQGDESAVIASNHVDAKANNMPSGKINADNYVSATVKTGSPDLNIPSDKGHSKEGIAENTNPKIAGQHASNHYGANNPSGSKEVGKTNANNLKTVTPGNNVNTSNNNIAASGTNNDHSKSTIGGNKIAAGKSTAATNGKTQNAAPPVPKPFEEQNVIETIYPVSNGNKANGTNNKPSANTANNGADMKVVAAHYNEEKIVKDENGSFFKEIRDTVRKIDMVQRTETKDNKTVIDTLAITRVERIRYTPLAPMEIASLRKANIIPKAEVIVPMARVKTITVASEMVNMVPLSDFKVASRKVDPSKFNQLVQNTSQGISNYFDGTNKFYAAILLGGNGFMGNPTAFGMQFGIAGLYQLSERLTLAGELKFANHYFSNYSINDQSVTYDNVSAQQSGLEWLFSGTQNTTTSAYKINSFSALEFPVTLSYSLGRVSVFGGVNMTYSFPAKWDRTNTVSSINVSSTEAQNQNPFLNSDFRLNEQKDFASRFGMGYVGGLSYDISRKLSFDARVTQNLWNNYNGDADAVNKLFKMPTFQFSIGYFFGRKERVVYILDK